MIKQEYLRAIDEGGAEVLLCLSNECRKHEEHRLFHYLGCECPCQSEFHVTDTIVVSNIE